MTTNAHRFIIELTDDDLADFDEWSGRYGSYEYLAEWAKTVCKAIEAQRPKPLQPGDTVHIDGHARHGVIIAIDDDAAWIRWWPSGQRTVWQLSSLRRVEPGEQP